MQYISRIGKTRVSYAYVSYKNKRDNKNYSILKL